MVTAAASCVNTAGGGATFSFDPATHENISRPKHGGSTRRRDVGVVCQCLLAAQLNGPSEQPPPPPHRHSLPLSARVLLLAAVQVSQPAARVSQRFLMFDFTGKKATMFWMHPLSSERCIFLINPPPPPPILF